MTFDPFAESFMLNVILAECRYAECHYAEYRYAECRYDECQYAECRGAQRHQILNSKLCSRD